MKNYGMQEDLIGIKFITLLYQDYTNVDDVKV